MPPAWDPPKLLLVVVSGLQVVVGTSRVVAVVIDSGVWLLDFNICSQQSNIERGKGGEQNNHDCSSKVLASKELHYICMHWYQMEKAIICGLNYRLPK